VKHRYFHGHILLSWFFMFFRFYSVVGKEKVYMYDITTIIQTIYDISVLIFVTQMMSSIGSLVLCGLASNIPCNINAMNKQISS
jgi:hypothetical protein